MGVFSKYHRFREAGEEANVIFGVMFDENEADDVTITVIATGMEDKELGRIGTSKRPAGNGGVPRQPGGFSGGGFSGGSPSYPSSGTGSAEPKVRDTMPKASSPAPAPAPEPKSGGIKLPSFLTKDNK